LVIVLSALTPLLILWGKHQAGSALVLGPSGFPPPNALVQTVPPAAASILAGFMASFGC
jgi:hypothetical protein